MTYQSPSSCDPGPAPEKPPSTVPPLRSRLISAGIWSFFGRLAAIALFFVTEMVLARALTKSEFGSFYLITQATVVLGAVASLGTPQILLRSIRQTLHGPHPEQTALVISICWRLLFVGSMISGVGFLLIGPLLASRGEQWTPFLTDRMGIVAWACLAGACLNAAYALQGLDDFRTATVIGSRRGGVLPNLLFLVFAITAWLRGFASISSLVYAQVVFQAFTLLAGRLAIRRRLLQTGGALTLPAPDRRCAATSHTYIWYALEGLPMLATLLASMALDELDGLWVGFLVSESETADYGVSKRLVRLMTMPYVMFGISLSPFTAELLAKHETARLERILRAAATLVSVPMAAALAAYLLAPQLILGLAFGAQFREAAPILRWLTLGTLCVVITGHSSQVLLMAGRQRTLMLCNLVALLAYAALIYPTVKTFGAPGAAALQSIVFGTLSFAVLILAKMQVGVWTHASLRPGSVVAAWKALRGRGAAASPRPAK